MTPTRRDHAAGTVGRVRGSTARIASHNDALRASGRSRSRAGRATFNWERYSAAPGKSACARNDRSRRQLEEHDGRVAVAPDALESDRGVELSGLVAIFNAQAQRTASPFARSGQE